MDRNQPDHSRRYLAPAANNSTFPYTCMQKEVRTRSEVFANYSWPCASKRGDGDRGAFHRHLRGTAYPPKGYQKSVTQMKCDQRRVQAISRAVRNLI